MGKVQKEIWKDVDGYVGIYQVSNLGNLKSLDRVIKHRFGGTKMIVGRHKSVCKGKAGYMMSGLYRGGKLKNTLVHRLVAGAFIPNLQNKPEVNHKNGIKTDNRMENLEWCTTSENQRHSFRVLNRKRSGPFGYRPVNARYCLQYKNGILLNVFASSTDAAKILGTSQGRISANCRGESIHCHGYKFLSRKNKPKSATVLSVNSPTPKNIIKIKHGKRLS